MPGYVVDNLDNFDDLKDNDDADKIDPPGCVSQGSGQRGGAAPGMFSDCTSPSYSDLSYHLWYLVLGVDRYSMSIALVPSGS